MEILSALTDGAKGPTRLAQSCNINYGRLNSFTRPLVERGLVADAVVDGQEVLSITPEGYRVYADWLEVWRRLPSD